MRRKLAGIITFNPNIDLLSLCINSIMDQVNQIIVVDNHSDNREKIKLLCHNEKIKIIFNKRNEGVSRALNMIMRYGFENGFSWCLLLDQDSVCPKDMLDKYDKYIARNDCTKVGVLCPLIYDRNEKVKSQCSEDFQTVVSCINSGSYNNVNAWEKIGGYDEALFIDLVDYDYCIRLNENYYNIVRINSIILEHSIGNVTIHRFLGKVFNHSKIRKFYMAEASVYLSGKHKSVRKKYKYLQHVYLRSLKRMVIVIFCEDDKIEKIKAIIRGVMSGRKLIRRY